MAVDTESLINQAIDAKAERDAQRQKLDAQQSSLVQQLGSVGRNRGRYHQLRADIDKLNVAKRELHSQDVQDQKVLDTRVSSAFRNAQMAHKASTDALNLQTAQQAGDVFTGFAKLMSATKPGTQEFRNGMEALKAQYPLGFASEAVKGHLGPIAQFHDQQAAQNEKSLRTTLFKNFSGMSPEQFANRDISKDRATNVPVLVNAKGEADPKGTAPSYEQIEKQRNAGGRTVATDIGGRTYLFDRNLFDNLRSTFGPNQPTNTSVVAQPTTNIQPIVPTYGGQGAAPPGGLVRNPDGSINPIVPTYGGEGAAPPGALARTDIGSTVDAKLPGDPYESGRATVERPATLPVGVQPNQPLQPVVQLGTQPMVNTPQVAAQPTVTPTQVAQQTTNALDTNAARSLLQEAGGDKDKARELAKSRGYTF